MTITINVTITADPGETLPSDERAAQIVNETFRALATPKIQELVKGEFSERVKRTRPVTPRRTPGNRSRAVLDGKDADLTGGRER